jgi:hypothetical protein
MEQPKDVIVNKLAAELQRQHGGSIGSIAKAFAVYILLQRRLNTQASRINRDADRSGTAVSKPDRADWY